MDVKRFDANGRKLEKEWKRWYYEMVIKPLKELGKL